ncbi:MAG: dihydrofolate reductase family protein [Bacillota bacterium]|jgi:2,5-diamino-6-(ribosylamino)-4(3H)-pyrimidinone 5'-phosphate reductase
MKTPKVVTYAVASVDGRVAAGPDRLLLFGDERWSAISGYDTLIDKRLRAIHNPEVILEGSGSLVLDDQVPEPLLPVSEEWTGNMDALYQDYLPEEVVSRPGQRGWFTVADSRGRIRWLYKEWPSEDVRGWHLMVLVSRSTPVEYLAYLRREVIPYIVAGEERVDFRAAFAAMAEKLGVTCVQAQGAARLNGALLRQGLVDEANIEVLPALVGGTRTPVLFTSPDLLDTQNPFQLELVSCETMPGGRVWLRYVRKSGEETV